MAGVYIHIPYCEKKCSYCDFHSSASTSDKKKMFDAIATEIDMCKDFFAHNEISTIYFGGGTPSYCTAQELGIMINKLKKHVDLSNVVEFTIEANPEDLSKEYLAEVCKLGFNRLSIGIQSFDDKVLTFFNRRHNSQKAIQAVRDAQEVGFDNISIDLIYGVDGFGDEIWEDSVKKALELNIQHISAYHLTIEGKSILSQKLELGEIKQIDENRSQSQFDFLHNKLTDNGFDHYEVSSFAVKGRESLHNSNYWRGVEYIGLAPSAHSYYNGSREWNVSNNRIYIDSIESNVRASEKEVLTIEDKYNEYVMVSLRTKRGIDVNYLKNNFPEYLYSYFIETAKGKIILKKTNDFYHISPKDFLLSDSVIVDFFYTE